MRARNIGVYLAMGVVLGQFYDDTLYMSIGKGLAKGGGFVMPSLPGTPSQTKYPILYP